MNDEKQNDVLDRPAMRVLSVAAIALLWAVNVVSVAVPSTTPSTASTIDPAQLSVSLEFFTFPDYTAITSTINCLANIGTLRGTQPAVRIGGTTQ